MVFPVAPLLQETVTLPAPPVGATVAAPLSCPQVVGGHSYGAFMTANLLAHTNFFAAGIARSGAYNRTLTPFGFQAEERTFWEAPETYIKMSPFTHADKIKTPLLLIHGEADNNSCLLYTSQSPRDLSTSRMPSSA